MILPDVNVLLYALRSDAAGHGRYRSWLEHATSGQSPFGLSPQVLSSVVRIATHPRIYRSPSRLEVALSFAQALLERPGCTVVVPGDRHWSIFDRLCREAGATGNLVHYAWLAAVAIESGCEWITTDRDFGRFSGLRSRRPF